jgi:hypothetical protein
VAAYAGISAEPGQQQPLLKAILQSKGVTLFAVIDHSGEAAKVGMKMPNTSW